MDGLEVSADMGEMRGGRRRGKQALPCPTLHNPRDVCARPSSNARATCANPGRRRRRATRAGEDEGWLGLLSDIQTDNLSRAQLRVCGCVRVSGGGDGCGASRAPPGTPAGPPYIYISIRAVPAPPLLRDSWKCLTPLRVSVWGRHPHCCQEAVRSDLWRRRLRDLRQPCLHLPELL